MYLIEKFYEKVLKKESPYYAKYPLVLMVYKPIRKYINVVLIPNTPFSSLRIYLYKLIGFKIGQNVFIGMKCYMDDIDPKMTEIGDNVTISYGCYFACHGKDQGHTSIKIKDGVYIGMRSSLISGKEGIEIGENAIIGAQSLVNSSVQANTTVAGVPAKIVS